MFGVFEIQTYGESLHILVDSAEIRLNQITKILDDERIDHYGARKAPGRMEEAFISLIRKVSAEEESSW